MRGEDDLPYSWARFHGQIEEVLSDFNATINEVLQGMAKYSFRPNAPSLVEENGHSDEHISDITKYRRGRETCANVALVILPPGFCEPFGVTSQRRAFQLRKIRGLHGVQQDAAHHKSIEFLSDRGYSSKRPVYEPQFLPSDRVEAQEQVPTIGVQMTKRLRNSIQIIEETISTRPQLAHVVGSPIWEQALNQRVFH